MRGLRAVAAALVVFTFPAWAAEVESVMLMYQAHEPGIAPYSSRILVTERYVRMDDGVDEGDYLVFDRQSRLISSVSHNDQTVFEIPPREITLEPPLPLQRRHEQQPVGNAPKVDGKQPEQHLLYVNESLCYSVVAVPGLMGDAVAALREFRQVLAGEHARVLPDIPADMQQPCDLALHTFHSGWQLQFGLPIQEWDEAGSGQVLVDYRQSFMVDNGLFTLPRDYRHYSGGAR
jgi:hypothetical protein